MPGRRCAADETIKKQVTDYAASFNGFQTAFETIAQNYQVATVSGYESLVLGIVQGLVGSTRIALVPWGHSVEVIRQAKLEKGVDAAKDSSNGSFLSSLQDAQRGFQSALSSADDVLTKEGRLQSLIGYLNTFQRRP